MFRSRWGYHPCDHVTYRKLQLLHRVYQEALHLAHAWQRWKRKEPHNRVLRRRIRNDQGQTVGYEPPVPWPEPDLCPVFTHKVLEKRHVDSKGNFCREGFLDESVVTDDWGIVVDHATARRPAPDATAVRPLRMSRETIDALWEQARKWEEGRRVR